jgi:hypothetical protein
MIWIGGRLRNRLVEWRMQAVSFRRRRRSGEPAGLPGFDRIAGLS